jgi:ABC-type Na+ efflux pump permease subunit
MKLIAIIAGVVVLLAIIGGVIALGGSGEEAPKQEPVTVAPVDSDSIKAAQMAAENQKLKDSLAAAEAAKQKAEEDAKKKPEEVKKPQPPTGGGSKNLGYATFKGSWPNDVNGRMVFKTSHVIDSKDPKGRVAEAGDYVIGEWADGHLVQGIWYGADNQVKGSVIIGR